MKVIIYTVNIGGYDTIKTHVKQTYPNVEYREYTSDIDGIAISARNNYEKSKRFRMGTPWLRNFESFDMAIYIDANVEITDPEFVEKIVESHSNEKWDFLMSKHPWRKNALHEIETCNSYIANKYSAPCLESLKHIVRDCNEELCWCGFNAQWLKSPRYKNLKLHFELWWDFIRTDITGVADDQITWPLVYSRLKDTDLSIVFKVIPPEHCCNHFFKLHTHKFEYSTQKINKPVLKWGLSNRK